MFNEFRVKCLEQCLAVIRAQNVSYYCFYSPTQFFPKSWQPLSGKLFLQSLTPSHPDCQTSIHFFPYMIIILSEIFPGLPQALVGLTTITFIPYTQIISISYIILYIYSSICPSLRDLWNENSALFTLYAQCEAQFCIK